MQSALKIGIDRLAAPLGEDGREHGRSDVRPQEADAAVGEEEVGAAVMETVDLAAIVAVDQAGGVAGGVSLLGGCPGGGIGAVDAEGEPAVGPAPVGGGVTDLVQRADGSSVLLVFDGEVE